MLSGVDTDLLLLIPREFVEVEARPVAAGGFAQVGCGLESGGTRA